jgi:8-oxo-dGTP diphosphatase
MPKKFVVGVLCKNGKYLAEKRQAWEDYYAGKIIFPGGSINVGETAEDALLREMEEELRISVKEHHFVGEFVYEDQSTSQLYAITDWEGEPIPIEAEKLIWIEREGQLFNKTNWEMLRQIKSKGF